MLERANGDQAFRDWLFAKDTRRAVSDALSKAGYEPVRNPAAKEGQWRIDDKRQTISGKRTKERSYLLIAAEVLAKRGIKAAMDDGLAKAKAAKAEAEAKERLL